ncbi:uncharacterized protein LOC143725557 [Siphateles boraxobius]|uniref:uncharacterized protein LOC143725557 n=1 Tax=Siphateles boraxobius TaxID=180520 RepID=UPI00406335C9
MPGTVSTSTVNATCVTMKLQVVLLFLLASCTSSNVPTTVKTVRQGETVNEPVLNISTLDEHDQLMAYHRGELGAQYFCNNGTCKNQPALVCQFQVSLGYLCLIIPNVTVSISGKYKVVLNGHKTVRNFILQVEEGPQRSQLSILVWLIPVIAVPLAAAVFLFIFLNYKILIVIVVIITLRIELLFELCSI